MRRSKLLLSALSLLGATAVQAQYNVFVGSNIVQPDTIGQVEVLVHYDTTARLDPTPEAEAVEETLVLEVGHGLSKCYSYPKFVRDSVYLSDIANRVPNEVVNAHLNQYNTSRLSETYFRGYPQTGDFSTLDEVGGCTLIRCTEPNERPQWRLTEETDTLLTYACRKAVCTFKGREWIAWFTPEIALSEGPWKLCGLPGLVLQAEDSEGDYRFRATGVEQMKHYRPILYSGQKHEPMSRKAYDKVHRRYYADPLGFLNAIPGVSMTVNGSKTGGPKDLPYNPIER